MVCSAWGRKHLCLGRKQSTLLSAASVPNQFDLKVHNICTRADVKWSLSLWNVYPRLKPLKSGRHLDSGEDQVWSLQGDQGQSLILQISNQKCGKKSEPLVWRIQISEEIKIQDSVHFTNTYKISKTKLTGLESNRKVQTLIFSLLSSPFFIKHNLSKTNLFSLKLAW